MANTQDFLPVEDIHDDVVIMKDGSMSIVLQTSAVNFDLLSETEQLAIIGTFAAMLNSLSFSIQILIRSKRLDISNYLNLLRDAESKQKNPLLQLMMQHYRQFVTNIIRENEVLDKQFYVVISVSYLEVGVVKNVEKNFQKALTILLPRRDHIMRQLGRIGLKTTQLEDEKLVKLFYDFYNDSFKSSFESLNEEVSSATPQAPSPSIVPQPSKVPNPPAPQPQPAAPRPQPMAATPQPIAQPTQPKPVQPVRQSGNYQSRPVSQNAPFVVEELPDDYSAI